MENIKLKIATLDNVSELEPIFTLYREFYGMERDSKRTIDFLRDRLLKNESILIFVEKDENIIGFAQLYPTFSSATLKKAYILNDLYVVEPERKRGIATLLINKSIEIAKKENCGRVSLSTAKDNPAQLLYENIGFKESSFKFYNYTL
ncbi:Predicted acetyltransferase [Sphingobacterium multivorum]|uniref:GNAT family N-acetyltransferase n=1 Tax=Sphingobacterium multivorum TaxID=28454 RepID=UPI000DFDB7BB|nr:GNAT family N-acetyltransferase [Sphingobacterium multivorum]QQT43506.1 GNAT family N-acetyltransferase [Sphingobacterium multivorum]SUI98008.1 Predicted acetyltransferase [Sphingobacterium multivorum]